MQLFCILVLTAQLRKMRKHPVYPVKACRLDRWVFWPTVAKLSQKGVLHWFLTSVTAWLDFSTRKQLLHGF